MLFSTSVTLALPTTFKGKYEEASALYERVTEIWEKVLGPDHPILAAVLSNRAMSLYQQVRASLIDLSLTLRLQSATYIHVFLLSLPHVAEKIARCVVANDPSRFARRGRKAAGKCIRLSPVLSSHVRYMRCMIWVVFRASAYQTSTGIV